MKESDRGKEVEAVRRVRRRTKPATHMINAAVLECWPGGW